MSHVVDIVLMKELETDYPRARTDDLVDPLAVLDDLDALELIHDDLALLLDGLFVSTNAYNEMNVLEQFLCLFQYFCMTHMEHVKDTVCVDSYWILRVATIGNSWPSQGVVLLGKAIRQVLDSIDESGVIVRHIKRVRALDGP